MINPDIFLVLANEMENPSFFPFPFPLHLCFSIFAFVFLLFRFFTEKKPFQLIMAVAVPVSLILWIPSTTMTLYYIVGLIELILVAASVVTSLFFKEKKKSKEKSEEKSEATE